jgi:hypothetical protein
MRIRSLVAAALVAAVLSIGAPVQAGAPLDVNVKEVHAPAADVRTMIEVRDLVPDRFRKVIDSGGLLHLRVQAELWESRPVWDRLVYPAIVRMFRVGRRPSTREITIDESSGSTASYPAVPNPLQLILDLGARDRVATAQQYYVHVIATIGTLAERDVDEVGDAVFGRESETNALGSFGRLVFRTALKVSDYLQSVSADARSRKLAGAEIIRP